MKTANMTDYRVVHILLESKTKHSPCIVNTPHEGSGGSHHLGLYSTSAFHFLVRVDREKRVPLSSLLPTEKITIMSNVDKSREYYSPLFAKSILFTNGPNYEIVLIPF
jgi:hypothetical protein